MTFDSTSTETFRFCLLLPDQWVQQGQVIHRDQFFEWLWSEFGDAGLTGVHEGTVLAEDLDAVTGSKTSRADGDPHSRNASGKRNMQLTSESWTVDSGLAPRERDWVGAQQVEECELYAATHEQAQAIRTSLGEVFPWLEMGEVERVEPQDWNATWKAAFMADPRGVAVKPNWRIQPAGVEGVEPAPAGEVVIQIHPGAGFGTGTHETTQLCLKMLGERSQAEAMKGKALDFGSGSGILAIAAAKLGFANVVGVEIDPLAVENALENAKANAIDGQVQFVTSLTDPIVPHSVDLIFANILRPVLLEYCRELVARLRPGGMLILSGLVESDLPPVVEAFESALFSMGHNSSQVRRTIESMGEWQAISWVRA